jgi:glycosyltransferase involved in cell wall biosynthesis
MELDIAVIIILVTTFLGAAVLVQLYYVWWVFGKLAFYKAPDNQNNREEPVSIIIAARNEYENLQRNLPAILNQDYPNFEVVVVNDCSWDESQKLLEAMQLEYKHLKVSQLIEQEKYPTGKKFALTIGIKAASHELMLFTDTDCEPSSNQWLRLMQQKFISGKEIVLGYSPYRRKKGFLNLYIRFETLMTALFYFSAAIMKNAFMGVGRNLAYRKSTFFRHKGFASHQHILSGDDDLFVNEAATEYNVAIQLNPDSFVYTEPKTTFEAYARQKSRHMVTGKYYKAKHKRFLGTYYASLFFFYATIAILLILDIQQWPVALSVYGVRLLSQLIVYYNAAKKLQCTATLWLLPVLDLIYLFYLIVFGLKGLFTRKRKVW